VRRARNTAGLSVTRRGVLTAASMTGASSESHHVVSGSTSVLVRRRLPLAPACRTVGVVGRGGGRRFRDAPDALPCVRCGEPADGGFVVAAGGASTSLWWNGGELSRWRPVNRASRLLAMKFMGVGAVHANRCGDCGLVFFET